MTAQTGIIYYTLDGSDPRIPGTSVEPISGDTLVIGNADKEVLIPTGPVSENWKGGQTFDDSSWISGTGGVGYERGFGYETLINTDVGAQMFGRNSSCYIRIPFTANNNLSEFNFLTLNMRYDDGFIAYINGTEVQRVLFTGTPAWNSQADGNHEAQGFESFDISSRINTLRQGQNLLAIQGLNVSTTSSDFIISAELKAGRVSSPSGGGVSPNAVRYTGPITLTESTQLKARVLDNDSWSPLTEAFFIIN